MGRTRATVALGTAAAEMIAFQPSLRYDLLCIYNVGPGSNSLSDWLFLSDSQRKMTFANR